MKLLESDGKKILRKAGLAVPPGLLMPYSITSGPWYGAFPVMLKAQVLQGRRGKRGLVRQCENQDEIAVALREMKNQLSPETCGGFLCESVILHAEECLVSFWIDAVGQICAGVSEAGGASVQKIQTYPLTSVASADSLPVPAVIKDVIRKLYPIISAEDILELEINPLAVLTDGTCVALDAKIEVDDAATFRHPEWADYGRGSSSARAPTEREKAYAFFQQSTGHRGTLGRYVELDGDIACVLSGGGASLVAMDALKRAGGRAANYVEMSGNPDPERVRAAVKIVLSKPGIKAIWIAGSCANFTDIKATVGATLQAISDLGLNIPIVIRRDGPNAMAAQEDAHRWAAEQGVSLRFDLAETDLDESARAVVSAANNL